MPAILPSTAWFCKLYRAHPNPLTDHETKAGCHPVIMAIQ